jgi:hypothetical protein
MLVSGVFADGRIQLASERWQRTTMLLNHSVLIPQELVEVSELVASEMRDSGKMMAKVSSIS